MSEPLIGEITFLSQQAVRRKPRGKLVWERTWNGDIEAWHIDKGVKRRIWGEDGGPIVRRSDMTAGRAKAEAEMQALIDAAKKF